MWYILIFIIGVAVGAAGTIVLACVTAAGDADRREERNKSRTAELYCGHECKNHYQCVDCPYYCGREDSL